MNTDTDKTPYYGEPWALDTTDGFLNKVVSAEGKCVSGLRPTRRAIQCVNACAGMADPAAELAAMREAIKEAYVVFKQLPNYVLETERQNPAWSKAELWGIERDIVPSISLFCLKATDKLQPFTIPGA